ncbi:SDR family oxidoreductase [Furfurilactobacillus curtus]|uniref:NAD-dependent dehydratase n=1 Tax=Furfurilactobacillus curtus TaxID=1746200 RepID=A0ABQ5JRE1_9LACO
MSHVLVLGAGGQIAQFAEQFMVEQDQQLTLFLRHPDNLERVTPDHEKVVTGDVTNADALNQAMVGQDIVYANLAGSNIEQQAKDVVTAMNHVGVKRLIWISTLGIYDEVPGAFGEWNHEMLDDGYLPTYTAAATVIETSGLDYTIIRPAWLQNEDEVSYELTNKGEPFKGTEVSRKSIGALVADIAAHPDQHVKASLGVNKPNTDGDKPSWY